MAEKMDVQRLVRTRVTTSDLDAPPELISSINDGSVPLVEVVRGLGEYLTSTDEVRCKALTLLANVIKNISPNRINRPAAQTLTRFFMSSLDDFDSLPVSLSALNVLAGLSTFDGDAAIEVFQAVCQEVNMKAYVQATRHLVYVLFDTLLAKHRKSLQSLGSDFISSYIRMVDGEKDPRNLMLLFAIDRVILLEFDIAAHTEDLFDITFCYFPIAFRPPPNDPYGISADDLKEALRGCLSATPLFAKMAIPLFIEKFATASGPAMKDLMLSMAACLPVYGAEAVAERKDELWECIKTEIMYSSDTSIEESALAALEGFIRALYPKPDSIPSGMAEDIVKQCLDVLQEPAKSQTLAATKILVALFNASLGAYAIAQALPRLIQQFNHPASPSHRIPILWTITSLLIAGSKVYSGDPERQYTQERVFELYKESLYDTLREGLRTAGLQEAAARGCVAAIEIKGMWTQNEVEEVVRTIGGIVVDGDTGKDVRAAIVKGLVAISTTQHSIIETSTLPLLFHSLPDSAPSISDSKQRTAYRAILGAITSLCVSASLFETLVIRIPNKLESLASSFSPPGEMDEEQRECNVAYAYDLVSCLDDTVKQKISQKHADIGKHFDSAVPKIWRLVVLAAQSRESGQIWSDRRLLGLVARLTDRMVWELDPLKQASVLEGVYAMFLSGNLGFVREANPAASPLRSGARPSEQDLVVLLTATIGAVKPTTELPFEPADFLARIVYWAIHTASDHYQFNQAAELLTAFVNKRSESLMQADALEGTLEQIWVGDVQDTSKDAVERERALHVFLYIARGLTLLRSPLSYTSVDRILEVLKLSSFDPDFVGASARGLSIIAKGKGKSKNTHLTAKLLWAQKMWNHVLPKIMAGDAEAKGKDRLVYLAAFASMLPLVPSSLLKSDLPKLLPLILRCLALPTSLERLNAISTLESILETPDLSSEADKLLHTRAEAIVEGLLDSIHIPKASVEEERRESSGSLRSAALRCISALPAIIRIEVLGKLKPRVLRELGEALDDPVREVRREAVECRAAWYAYK